MHNHAFVLLRPHVHGNGKCTKAGVAPPLRVLAPKVTADGRSSCGYGRGVAGRGVRPCHRGCRGCESCRGFNRVGSQSCRTDLQCGHPRAPAGVTTLARRPLASHRIGQARAPVTTAAHGRRARVLPRAYASPATGLSRHGMPRPPGRPKRGRAGPTGSARGEGRPSSSSVEDARVSRTRRGPLSLSPPGLDRRTQPRWRGGLRRPRLRTTTSR